MRESERAMGAIDDEKRKTCGLKKAEGLWQRGAGKDGVERDEDDSTAVCL